MGGESSTPPKPIPEKTRVPGSIRPNYQAPVRSNANVTKPAPKGKNLVGNDIIMSKVICYISDSTRKIYTISVLSTTAICPSI